MFAANKAGVNPVERVKRRPFGEIQRYSRYVRSRGESSFDGLLLVTTGGAGVYQVETLELEIA